MKYLFLFILIIQNWYELPEAALGIFESNQCVPLKHPIPDVAFVHVPKTGGETIEAALKIIKNHKLAHMRHDELTNETIVSIAVVRNNFDRVRKCVKFIFMMIFSQKNININPPILYYIILYYCKI